MALVVPGQTVNLDCEIIGGSTPVVTVIHPDGTTTTPTVAPAGNIFRATLTPDLLGRYLVRWASTGEMAVQDPAVDVYATQIASPTRVRNQVASRSKTLDGIIDATIAEAVRTAADQWNELAHVACAPFGEHETIRGNGMAVRLRRNRVTKLVSVKVADVDRLADAWVDYGMLRIPEGFNPAYPVDVVYEHGLDSPPGAVVDAIIERAIELLIPSAQPARSTSVATEIGYARLSLAGRDGSTGIPDFDATAALYGWRGART